MLLEELHYCTISGKVHKFLLLRNAPVPWRHAGYFSPDYWLLQFSFESEITHCSLPNQEPSLTLLCLNPLDISHDCFMRWLIIALRLSRQCSLSLPDTLFFILSCNKGGHLTPYWPKICKKVCRRDSIIILPLFYGLESRHSAWDCSNSSKSKP